MTIALDAGVRFFQYRSKTGTRREIYETCSALSPMARQAGALFIVNDHADIAAAVEADGVHLGQDDLPIAEARRVVGTHAIIGISTHSREQAMAAERSGADYIGFGPVFPTTTKDAGGIQGVEPVRAVRKAVSLPIVAIGGIGPGNCREVLSAGADAVAVIAAILSASDLAKATREMMDLIHNR
jgi:thiamine-phosphate diphosphorylase